MGACNFECTVQGKTAGEAFRSAIEEAQYDHGHAGYSGTIAEKNDYVMIHDSWKDIKELYVKTLESMAQMLKDIAATTPVDFDWDPICEELGKLPVPTFITSSGDITKTKAANLIRKEMGRLRGKRNSCTAKMTADDIANHLLFEICDDRVGDKYGPAGCIDLDPKLSGKRKLKRFLFFGMARS